jgi:hypothetical protein
MSEVSSHVTRNKGVRLERYYKARVGKRLAKTSFPPTRHSNMTTQSEPAAGKPENHEDPGNESSDYDSDAARQAEALAVRIAQKKAKKERKEAEEAERVRKAAEDAARLAREAEETAQKVREAEAAEEARKAREAEDARKAQEAKDKAETEERERMAKVAAETARKDREDKERNAAKIRGVSRNITELGNAY